MSAVEGWKTSVLSELCSIEIGGTPSRNNPSFWDASKETLNRWVAISDMNKKVIIDTAEHISNLGIKHSNVKLQNPGTILLSFKLSIGRVAFAGVPLYTNEAIAGLNSNIIDRNYLFHGLQHWNLLQDVDQAIKGATLNKAKLKKIKFDYPPDKSEQAKIAEILSMVDKAIEQTEALIAKQQRIKTGLMQDLLTRGIDKHGNLRSEKTHKFKDSPLGRIPVEWNCVRIGAITKSLVPGRDKPELDDGGIPWITIPDIDEIYTQNSKSGLSLSRNAIKAANARLMPKGTVLMSCVGEFGIASIAAVDVVANQQLHGFICTKEILPVWLVLQLTNIGQRIDCMATQTTIKYLNKTGCESILIALPDKDEQKRSANLLSAVLNLQSEQRLLLTKYQFLKTALMQNLLTGKKRITTLLQDVDDTTCRHFTNPNLKGGKAWPN